MKWLLKLLLYLNVILVLVTLVGYVASYVDPQLSTIPQVMGLFMPWFLISNFVLFVFWASLRSRWMLLSGFCLLVGINQSFRFVGFHFGNHNAQGDIGICSFNSQSYNESDHLAKFLGQIKDKQQIDFLCLQEITENHITDLKKKSGLKHHYFYKGKAILSKFPIEAQGNIQFDNSVNGCIWIDILWENRKFRVYDLHLKSNQVTREAESVLDDINTNREKALSDIKRMVSNYRKASLIRKEQVERILRDVDKVPHPVIIAGDFNDTPFSYTYQRFSNRMVDHFRKKGLGVGSTYAGPLTDLKIDYIFAD